MTALVLFISLFPFASSPAAEPPPAVPMVHASLVTEKNGIVAGETFRAGVTLEPPPGWHTYWENPGDAGMATTLEWTLPEGFSANGIEWPLPQRVAEGELVTFSYPAKVLLPVTVTPTATLAENAYTVKVKASWLVCKDICIPESADLQLMLPVVQAARDSDFAMPFQEARKALPQKAAAPLPYHVTGKQLSISLKNLNLLSLKSATFFPRDQDVFLYAPEQKLDLSYKDNPQLTLDTAATPSAQLSGYLVVTAEDGSNMPYDVTLAPSAAPAPATPPPADTALPVLLLFALLGGLVLNLMPCVLPVLSLKALAVVKKASGERSAVRKQGIAYTLGILASFTVIAGILITLQQAGEAVGWGYQMQSPAFVGFLIYLLFAVGLSLSGVFHLPVLLGNVGAVDESSAKGSFFTGVLATAVATPCTAPFMASAVGAALTLTPLSAMLIFEALGFGLALPFLLISFFPDTLRFLPKPGAWMERFKQVLAFPMYASVIWLLWVLSMQTGADGVVVALSGLLGIIIIIWMQSRFTRTMALIACALILLITLPMLSRLEATTVMTVEGAESAAFSKEKLDALRAQGKPVYVDATAAWCLTCQVNARVALHTTRTMEAFRKNNVVLMIADWTRPNPEITAFLTSFGYRGVPLNVLYPAHGEPKVLPQLLTEDTVINAIEGK